MSWYMFPVDQSDPFLPPLFRFDATGREDIESSADWSKVPLEDRTRISDHRYVNSDIADVEGILSPLMPFVGPRGEAGVTDAVAAAVDALKAGQLLTCVFGFEVLNMGLAKFKRGLSTEDGLALRCTISLVEVRTVTTETISVPPSRLKRRQRRKAAARKGGVSTAPTELSEIDKALRDIPSKAKFNPNIGKKITIATQLTDPIPPGP